VPGNGLQRRRDLASDVCVCFRAECLIQGLAGSLGSFALTDPAHGPRSVAAHEWMFVGAEGRSQIGETARVAGVSQSDGGVAAEHPDLGASDGGATKGVEILLVSEV
jgi:hypothetical protein